MSRFALWRAVRSLMDDRGLSTLALAVGTALASHANAASGVAWPSLDTLAREAHCSRRAAIDAVAELRERGHARQLSRGSGRRSSRYEVTAGLLLEQPETDRSVVVHHVHPCGAPRAPKQTNEQIQITGGGAPAAPRVSTRPAAPPPVASSPPPQVAKVWELWPAGGAPRVRPPERWRPSAQHRARAERHGLDLRAEALTFATRTFRPPRCWNERFDQWLDEQGVRRQLGRTGPAKCGSAGPDLAAQRAGSRGAPTDGRASAGAYRPFAPAPPVERCPPPPECEAQLRAMGLWG